VVAVVAVSTAMRTMPKKKKRRRRGQRKSEVGCQPHQRQTWFWSAVVFAMLMLYVLQHLIPQLRSQSECQQPWDSLHRHRHCLLLLRHGLARNGVGGDVGGVGGGGETATRTRVVATSGAVWQAK
jgi:hypothetical protein